MPLDRGLIEQQLAALGEPASWWERREMRDLPAVLHGDELIQAISLARMPRSFMSSRTWLVVVTDRRVVCLQTDKRMGRRQLDLHAGQITDISVRSRLRSARVIVRVYGETYRLGVRRGDAVKLIAAISRLIPTRERPLETRHSTGAMVGRVIQHMLALPSAVLDEVKPATPAVAAGALSAEQRLRVLEEEVQRLPTLEEDVQRLQQQVDFLEQLLQQRSILTDRPERQVTGQAGE